MRSQSRGNSEYAELAKQYCEKKYDAENAPSEIQAQPEAVAFEIFAREPEEDQSTNIPLSTEFVKFALVPQQSPDIDLDKWWYNQRFLYITF